MFQSDWSIAVTSGGDEGRAIGWNAVKISAADNVAVALRALRCEAYVLADGRIQYVSLTDEIPLGHKLALADLPAGTAIRKYGSVIGISSHNIAAGEHVHTHNLVSARKQERTKPATDEAAG